MTTFLLWSLGAAIVVAFLEINTAFSDNFARLTLRNFFFRCRFPIARSRIGLRVWILAVPFSVVANAVFLCLLPITASPTVEVFAKALGYPVDTSGAFPSATFGLVSLLVGKGALLYSTRARATGSKQVLTKAVRAEIDDEAIFDRAEMHAASKAFLLLRPFRIVTQQLYEVLFNRIFESRREFVMSAIVQDLCVRYTEDEILTAFNTARYKFEKFLDVDQSKIGIVLQRMLVMHRYCASSLAESIQSSRINNRREEARKGVRYSIDIRIPSGEFRAQVLDETSKGLRVQFQGWLDVGDNVYVDGLSAPGTVVWSRGNNQDRCEARIGFIRELPGQLIRYGQSTSAA